LPFFVFAQTTKSKPSTKQPKTQAKVAVKPVVAPPAAKTDGYIINGAVKGYPDGTAVLLLNPQSGVPEAEAVITKEKFTFTGKMASPDFRYLMFNKQPPYVAIFLDNSIVSVTGTSDAIDKLQISGSPSHQDFVVFNAALSPYQNVFVENSPYDSVAFNRAAEVSYDFASKHPAAFINPLAIFRYYQASEDVAKTDELYNQLTPEVKATTMGSALGQVIAQAKQSAVGYIMPDFTQIDTAGAQVSLASFRGKYVLVDFWASWCGPCRQENPNVVAAFNKYKDKNFTVLSISIDRTERKAEWLRAIKEDNLTWTHLLDGNGTLSNQFQIATIPQNFLIDPQGKVLARNLRGPALERKLVRLLH
jgi:peroxiredoxin